MPLSELPMRIHPDSQAKHLSLMPRNRWQRLSIDDGIEPKTFERYGSWHLNQGRGHNRAGP